MKTLCFAFIWFVFAGTLSSQGLIWHKFDRDTSVSIVDTLPMHADYVMITVHSSQNSDEHQIWQLRYNDSSYVGKSTHAIYTNRIMMPYEEHRANSFPVIELTRQSLRPSVCDSIFYLYFGDQEQTSQSVHFHEIAYFPRNLPYQETLSFQTYLAIKFGITLDNANYITPRGEVLWSNVSDADYYHRVTGIGKDSTYLLDQTYSIQSEDAATLTLYSEDLKQGDYYLIGDDDGAFSFTHRDTLSSVLSRTWKLRPYVDNEYHDIDIRGLSILSIKVNPQEMSCSPQDFALIHYADDINSTDYELHYADSVDEEGNLYFSDIIIDEDNSGMDYFGVSAYPYVAQTRVRGYSNGSDAENEEEWNTTRCDGSFMNVTLTPNPSEGPYRLSIELSEEEDVRVYIYDEGGRLVDDISLEGQSEYTHDGELSAGQVYIIDVVSLLGREQIKYIVR